MKKIMIVILCSWAMTGYAADSAGKCTKSDKEVKVPGKDEAEMKKNCEILKGTWTAKKKQEAGGGGGW